jgi:hypothetical protein
MGLFQIPEKMVYTFAWKIGRLEDWGGLSLPSFQPSPPNLPSPRSLPRSIGARVFDLPISKRVNRTSETCPMSSQEEKYGSKKIDF